MTQARYRGLKRVLSLGRRTVGRQFRLLPDDEGELRNDIGYILAVTANRYGIGIVAFIAMCNHYHASVADKFALGSEFMRDFHTLCSRYLNHRHGIVGLSLWDNRKPFESEKLDRESAWDDIIYMLLNPVRAGIVAHPRMYNGLVIGPDEWGKELTFTRPKNFFRDGDEGMPETVTLVPIPPKGFEDQTLESIRRSAQHEIKQKAKAIARNTRFSGLEGLTTRDTPKTAREKRQGRKVAPPELGLAELSLEATDENGAFEPRRLFSAKDPRVVQLAIDRENSFRSDFVSCCERLSDGESDVVFPAGTYALRMRRQVQCEPLPDFGWYALASMVHDRRVSGYG